MKKALVLGASGGMGYAIVKELNNRGIETIAFARNKQKLDKLFQGDSYVHSVAGDVLDQRSISQAAKDVDVIFHAVNFPYAEWEEKQPLLINNLIKTVQEHQIKLAVVDNIYAYGKCNGMEVTEEAPKKPHTKKGKLRLRLEEMVKASGIPFIYAHFPDFYGPNAQNAILQYTLDGVLKNKKASFVGKLSVPREYIFTPDGAKALVELALRDEAYGQNWNIPGTGVITGDEILHIVKELTGYKKQVTEITPFMIRLLGLFNANMREVLEVLYLTEETVVLNGEKYESLIGVLPKTSYKDGLAQTLRFFEAVAKPN